MRNTKKNKLETVMSPYSTTISVPQGKVLLEQGNYSREAFLVLSGEIDIIRDGKSVATVKEGELLGEAGLLNPPYIRNASAVTKTECSIAVMTPPEFSALSHTSNEFTQLVQKTQHSR